MCGDWGMCAYVIIQTILPPSPVILYRARAGWQKMVSMEFLIPWSARPPLLPFWMRKSLSPSNKNLNETINLKINTLLDRTRERQENVWDKTCKKLSSEYFLSYQRKLPSVNRAILNSILSLSTRRRVSSSELHTGAEGEIWMQTIALQEPRKSFKAGPPWFEFLAIFDFFAPWYRRSREASSVKFS